MTLKNNRTHLLTYFKLCASFRSHWWIQTGVTVRKRAIWVKIGEFLYRVILTFDGWPWKTIGLTHFKLCASFSSHWWIQTGARVRKCPFLSKSATFFVPCDREIRWMNLKNNRAPFLCYLNLCASFRIHLWIQTWVMIRKSPNWGKICFDLCDLDIWPLTLTLCMDINFVHGNNSWTLWKGCNRRTDGQKCS